MKINGIQYLYSLIPIIFAGISNMIFVKSKWLRSWYFPIDNKTVLKDGNRLFGDNKTWKGFIGMIVLTSAWTTILRIYPDKDLIPKPVWWFCYFGAMLGLAYVLFELPNSFIKRRLNIPPGENVKGIKGFIFKIIDQLDSLVGCAIILGFFTAISFAEFCLILLVTSVIHYLINILMYILKLKSQAG